MAKLPVQQAQQPDLKALEDEACDRIDEAKAQKTESRQDIEEAYYFMAPRRIRSASSDTKSKTQSKDAFELQTSLGFEMAHEFMTILIDSFLTPQAPWAERRPDPFLPKGVQEELRNLAKVGDKAIFEMIRSTNFYGELSKTGVPDAAIGVIAMDIRRANTYEPPRCMGIPIRELEINLGPDGRIDDRFVVRGTKYKKLKALLPGIKLPADIEKKIRDKPKGECTVRWGYWRLWERTDDCYWQHVVMVDKKLVYESVTKGDGSCPLVIGRFGATPDFAWPEGPAIKSLPDFRQLDEVRAGFIENIDFTLRPPFYFPDDGVMSFEDGVEPGMGYPKRPGGSPHDLGKIYEPNPLQAAIFDSQELERRIRRLHFCDFPEQKGKTPPTASQWLDEMVEAQKKIGTPGYTFWGEFPYEAFNRFRFIAEAAGGVKPLEYKNAAGQMVKTSLQAYNPAQRAQENQDVLTATRLLQIAAATFPQTLAVMVDDRATIENLKSKLGDELVTLRDVGALQDAFANVASLAGVAGPKAPGGLLAAGNGNAG